MKTKTNDLETFPHDLNAEPIDVKAKPNDFEAFPHDLKAGLINSAAKTNDQGTFPHDLKVGFIDWITKLTCFFTAWTTPHGLPAENGYAPGQPSTPGTERTLGAACKIFYIIYGTPALPALFRF